MADDRLPPAVRTLIGAGVKLAKSTTSGRVAFAQAHAVVDPAAVPARLRESLMAELDAAAEAVKPVDGKTIGKVLKDAWGKDAAKVVDDLDLGAPLAVTPGAQVHRASVDGAPVAVKVLRPGVRDAIRSDLGLLETLTAPAGAAFPAVDAGAVIREVRERILDELDLEHEAATQRTVARALRRHPSITVPNPDTELSHENVLVSAFVEGPTLADANLSGDAAAGVARTLLRAAMGLPRTTGVLHADIAPQNVIVTGQDSIALVDFGASRRVDVPRLDLGLATLSALRDGDEDAFVTAIVALGVFPDADGGAAAFALARAVAGDLLTGPARLDADALLALNARAEDHLGDALRLSRIATLDPQDLWALRMLGTLVATLARLGVTEDWIALALEAGREGC
ncbi:MAG: hypothetical protein JWM31_1457 [Solirubrobacterales bacterium]|nr:hypothetical protein [Solirubrobacterales bacterium]